MTKLALTIPGSSGAPGEQLVAPSGVPKALQGGLDTAGQSIFQTGINMVFIVAATLAVIVIMYAGIQWTMSGGDSQKIADARKRILYAVIGLVVAALAFFIVNTITVVLGGKPGNFFNPSQLVK